MSLYNLEKNLTLQGLSWIVFLRVEDIYEVIICGG